MNGKKKRRYLPGGAAILTAAALLFGFYREQAVLARPAEQKDEKEVYVSFAPEVTSEMYEPDYWADKYGKAGKILMNRQEKQEFLDALYQPEADLLRDIREEDTGESGMDYGICVERTGLWETLEEAGAAENENRLTSVRINTAALIDRYSEDGTYCHLILNDYEGWTEADHIAVCTGREEWLEAQDAEPALVVTAPRLWLEESGTLLTMGTRLRLLTVQEAAEAGGVKVSGSGGSNAGNWGCYTVLLPVRREDGSYGTETAAIPCSDSVHIGDLPLTTRNLLKQMFCFLGNRYGWGGSYDSVDCSALVQEVMACFGLDFPRNAADQIRVPGELLEFDDTMTEKERKKLLDTLAPGALLYFPGHIMFYLGKEEGQYYVLSALSSALLPEDTEPEVLQINRVTVNTLELRRKNGNSWLEELTAVLRVTVHVVHSNIRKSI